MKKNRIWYLAIILSVLVFVVYIGDFIMTRDQFFNSETLNTEESLSTIQKGKVTKLPIPSILEDTNPEEGKAEFELNVQYGKTEFFEDQKADTLGYNGSYLGPIIKVNKGDEVKINVNNALDESTTVHWHGLEVPAEMDGGPHQGIEPKSTWSPAFTINQPAATLW
ncbi:MAG: multicopper oxidase domain-containing protein [Carnobacterium sp.]|uniref:multicopper oxidase domain-containing protein n=1 Tax=Carnobacterium sp. TaxID=48221 RepID=UPI003C71E271